MSKIDQAQKVLDALGLPPAQCNEMSALTLLALCSLRRRDAWRKATRSSLTVTKGIMAFVKEHYKKDYAANTRETFRRQVLHQFMQAAIVDYNPDDPGLPTNSPRAHYAITDAALETVREYGTPRWRKAREKFIEKQGSLRETYRKRRDSHSVPVRLADGQTVKLSPGEHNQIQAAIVESFAPHFAPGARLLYMGDTAKKKLYLDKDALSELGVAITDHDKLPDVVLHDDERDRVFLIEAVTSHGPMSPKRLVELEKMFSECKASKIFVSAFPSFERFQKHLKSIAWETEVWIVSVPDHLIHYNGESYLQGH